MMALPRTCSFLGVRSTRRRLSITLEIVVGWLVDHKETRELLERYVALLGLPTDRLRVTTERRVFERWLGRRLRSSIGGAYTFAPASGDHLILINLPRIDQSRPRSLEVVVAEELLHMRDRLMATSAGTRSTGTIASRTACRLSPAPRWMRFELRFCRRCGDRRATSMDARAAAFKFLDTGKEHGRVECARRGLIPTSFFNCSQCRVKA